MASSAAIGLHNAFKDPVDTDPFIDAACSSATDAAGFLLVIMPLLELSYFCWLS